MLHLLETICSFVVSPNCKIDSLSHFHPVIRWPARSRPPTTRTVVFLHFSMVGGPPPQEDFNIEQFTMLTNVGECDGSSAFCFSYQLFVRVLPHDILYEGISHCHIYKLLVAICLLILVFKRCTALSFLIHRLCTHSSCLSMR